MLTRQWPHFGVNIFFNFVCACCIEKKILNLIALMKEVYHLLPKTWSLFGCWYSYKDVCFYLLLSLYTPPLKNQGYIGDKRAGELEALKRKAFQHWKRTFDLIPECGVGDSDVDAHECRTSSSRFSRKKSQWKANVTTSCWIPSRWCNSTRH